MLLFKITNKDTDEVYYLSKQSARALDSSTLRFWQPKVQSIGALSYRMDKRYGGMVQVQRGALTLDLDTFEEEGTIPYLIDVEVRYMKEGEATISNHLFSATCYITTVNTSSIHYTAKEKEIAVNVLDDAPDFDTETDRVYPIAFGDVDFVLPLRVGTTSNNLYYKGGITGTDPTIATGDYDVYDDGRQKEDCVTEVGTVLDNGVTFYSVLSTVKCTTLVDTDFEVGDTATLTGPAVATYGLTATVDGVTITAVDDAKNFWITTTKNTQGDFGISGSDLVITKTGGGATSVSTISIRANPPRGNARISGTGVGATLSALFTWGAARINADAAYSGYTVDTSLMSVSAMPIGMYITEQIKVTELLSRAAAFYGHLFYINDDTKVIHLVDIRNTQTATDLSDTTTGVKPEYFKVQYKYPLPLKELAVTWETNEAGTDGDGNPYFVQAENKQTVVGTTFGSKEELIHATKDIAQIKAALLNVGDLMQIPSAPVEIPFARFDIVPGNRYSWKDIKTKDISVTIITTSIQLNLDRGTASLEGLIL